MENKHILGPVLLIALALGLVRLGLDRPHRPVFEPPDFKVPRFADLSRLRAAFEPVASPARLEAPAWLGTATVLSPSGPSEPGVQLGLDASGAVPRLVVENVSDPRVFLSQLEVTLRCREGQAEVTLPVLRPAQSALAPWPPALGACSEPPRYLIRAAARWSMIPEDADRVATMGLTSGVLPEGGYDFLSLLPTPRGIRTLVLLAARQQDEAARAALVQAWPGARPPLLQALAALDDAASPLFAMLSVPEVAAPALRVDPSEPGWAEAMLVAIYLDRRLPTEALLPPAQRPALLARVEASERARASATDEARIDRRLRRARAAIFQALAGFPDEEVASALVASLARSSPETVPELALALRAMPRSAAQAAAELLACPTGKERSFLLPALVAAVPELDEALAAHLHLTPVEAEAEARARWHGAREARSRRLWDEASVQAARADFEAALRTVRGLAPRPEDPPGLLAGWTLAAARAAGEKGDLAGALGLLSGAGDGPEVVAERLRLEARVLDQMLLAGVVFTGPGPQYAPLPVAGKHRLEARETLPNGWTLVAAPGFAAPVVFLPPGVRASTHLPTGARLDPTAVLDRLDELEVLGLTPANATAARLQAWGLLVRGPLAVLLAVLLLLGAVEVLARPAAAGRALFRAGLPRLGLLLGRWGLARHPPVAAVAYARMLVARAEAVPKEAPARLAAADEALEIFGGEREARSLAGHVALLRGGRERAYRLHTRYLEGTTLKWARRLSHLDLARLALHEDRLADAAMHGEAAGRGEGALIAGAARLALGTPRVRLLARAALVGPSRGAALALLAHALLDLERPALARWVLRLLPAGEPRARYARARLAHGWGEVSQARREYQALEAQAKHHGGARLGLALLDRIPGAQDAGLEELARGEGDGPAAARALLAREDLARGDAKRAAERLRLPRVGVADLELLGVAEAARERWLEAAEAFRFAAARGADVARAAGRVETMAAAALARRRPEDALRVLVRCAALRPAQDEGWRALRREASAQVVTSLLRRDPAQALGEAMVQAVAVGADPGDVPRLPPGLVEAAHALAAGDLGRAAGLLEARARDADDAVARLFLALVGCAAGGTADLDRLAVEAVAAAPGFAPAAAVLLAAARLESGREDLARGCLAGLEDRLPDGPLAFHAEALAARLGLPSLGALDRPLLEARAGRALEAARLLDALDGPRPAPLTRVRAAVAREAAQARLQVADLPGAAAELEAMFAYPGLARARVDEEALQDALAELSLQALPRLVLHDPARALRVLERSRALPPELAPKVEHDRAFAALAAALQAGAAPTDELLASLGVALDRLGASPAALAHFRLRRLELAGEAPVTGADLEAELASRTRDLVARYLVFLLEAGQGKRLHAVLEPWSGPGRSGAFAEALQLAADLVEAELREVLRATQDRLSSLRALEQAVPAWREFDDRVTALLDRLRDLRAETVRVCGCEDAAARCMDALSVHVHNTIARGALPQRILERALALAHSGPLREHLLENRRAMA